MLTQSEWWRLKHDDMKYVKDETFGGKWLKKKRWVSQTEQFRKKKYKPGEKAYGEGQGMPASPSSGRFFSWVELLARLERTLWAGDEGVPACTLNPYEVEAEGWWCHQTGTHSETLYQSINQSLENWMTPSDTPPCAQLPSHDIVRQHKNRLGSRKTRYPREKSRG